MIYQITEEQRKKLIDAIEWSEMLADTSDKSCQDAAWSIEHAKTLLQSLEPVSQEPVELRFPTALRKMWSGSEVQNWIDQQGQLFSHSVEQLPVGYFYFDEGNWKQATDPISFSGCTKLYKQATSQTPSSRDLARLAPFVGGLGMSILKELMDAAPQPAQEQNVDAARVLEWMHSKPRKAAQLAFTEGPDRQAAYWIEIAQAELPTHRTQLKYGSQTNYQTVNLPYEIVKKALADLSTLESYVARAAKGNKIAWSDLDADIGDEARDSIRLLNSALEKAKS